MSETPPSYDVVGLTNKPNNTTTEVWLRLWTEDGGSRDPNYTGGYVGLVVASIIVGSVDLGYVHFPAAP